jgi:choloylglycine hydrolase
MGIACIRQNVPLYYDAINEAGLAVAGLNFPGNAVYHAPKAAIHNVASFELIPWILCQCETLEAAIELLQHTNITRDCFSAEMPATPLHWLIADKSGSVTVETVAEGLKIYENPFGVLTNNPPFPYHQINIANFMHLDSRAAQNNLCPSLDLAPYSRGMGAMGLPGDHSSPSRLVRAVFAKNHTAPASTERDAVSRFFHMMDTVSVPCGCVKTEQGKSVLTVYTSCASTDTFAYYFTPYRNRRIRAVCPNDAQREASDLLLFSMQGSEDMLYLPFV